MPALFGKSLKKNMIYDLLNNNQIENISLYSTFQWYDLNWLKNDIDLIIKHNIKICNLFPEPLSSLEIIHLFNYPIETFKNKTIVNYNIKTKYSTLFDSLTDGYIRDKTTVLHNLRVFLNFQKIDKSKLVVSNICVKTISQLQFSCILKLFGIQNVQIAPTTLIENWNELPNMNLDIFTNNNINIYSFQSITYGLNHLNIFDVLTNDTLFQHITKVIDYGILHKIKVFVFGCPKNRKILKLNEINDEIFCNFFKKIGEYIGENNLTICIEPNSKNYGCNYINTIKEAGNLVNKINNKNIKMMVDIGNAMMENDDLLEIYNFKNIIYNIDFSNKNMEPLIHLTKEHNMFIKTLREINYNKKINLEMLITNENELDILIKSLNNFVYTHV